MNPFSATLELQMKSDYANRDSLKWIAAELKKNPKVADVAYQVDLMVFTPFPDTHDEARGGLMGIHPATLYETGTGSGHHCGAARHCRVRGLRVWALLLRTEHDGGHHVA